MTPSEPTVAGRLREPLLVLRCQAGDEDAFAALYERYGEPIRRYLLGFLDPEDAEDVMQDVWLTVYRKIRGLTNPAGFRAWLFRTARHRAIDALRAGTRRARVEVESFDEERTAGAARLAQPGLETGELMAALAALSADHREVVRLRFFEDLSYAEIATVTGCPLGTVRSRIHNAKDRLRDVIANLDRDQITTGGGKT